ncbi:hypothetical protein RRG08_044676 [Elysia crispata]|uniref:PB1 domain-containing protein n=1 Tax=Elysia crispata TaxID=231223 RepID=A0AAE0ZYY7_9GAST|nr:hypothetical protein RRG08_044676 [Elysia crispata]
MELTVKVFLHKLDSSVEVRRFPMNLGRSPHKMSGQFGLLVARIASAYPSLKGKAFNLTWKDPEGDLVLMSSDEELSEAFAASNSSILKVQITETATTMQNAGAYPRVLPTAPPQPYYEHEPIEGPGQNGAPAHPFYPSAPEMHGNYHFMAPPPHAGIMNNGPHPMMGAAGHMAAGPCLVKDDSSQLAMNEKKAWRTALRDQVPAPHRRWAKGYIRQWRSANVENATTSTSSDGEKGRRMTREEAGVPETYVQWLDKILPKMHKYWAKECKDYPENISKEIKEIKCTVPEEFQNWCQWYLKRHFKPRSTSELKSEGQDKLCAGKGQKRDWKAIRKEMKKSVPRAHRLWTKIFIKQWQEDHLGGQCNTTSSSGTDSGAEAAGREAIYDEIIIPADYPRWLRKFLNWKYSNIGVTLSVPDQEVVGGGMDQFKDTVPQEYRKWARSYVNHRLQKGKKSCKRNQEIAGPSNQYHKWLFAFQKRWLEQVQGYQDSASMGVNSAAAAQNKCAQFETNATGSRTQDQIFNMDRLREVINTSDSEEENEGPSQNQKIPHEFRQWARDALNQWDGMTLCLPPAEHKTSQQSSKTDQDDIPPRMLNWMIKMMTRIQMRKMKMQMRAEKQERKMQRKEAKAEKKAAREGFKMAKRSLKVARQAIKFRYV